MQRRASRILPGPNLCGLEEEIATDARSLGQEALGPQVVEFSQADPQEGGHRMRRDTGASPTSFLFAVGRLLDIIPGHFLGHGDDAGLGRGLERLVVHLAWILIFGLPRQDDPEFLKCLCARGQARLGAKARIV